MCQICTRIEKLPQERALAEIGVEMKKGRNAEHFKKLLDRILGTEEPSQDAGLDEAWERNQRG